MTLSTWLTYLSTVLILMSIPGPSQILMLSNSMQHGSVRSMMTALGDLTANLLQMLCAGLGLAMIVMTSATLFIAIKWIGVAYLAYIGFKKIFQRAHQETSSQSKNTVSLSKLYWQGFITSAANPKAIIFFSALFPQFINTHHVFLPQFSILSATYILLDALFLTTYSYCAMHISKYLKSKNKKLLDWLGGGAMLIAAGVLAGKNTLSRI